MGRKDEKLVPVLFVLFLSSALLFQFGGCARNGLMPTSPEGKNLATAFPQQEKQGFTESELKFIDLQQLGETLGLQKSGSLYDERFIRADQGGVLKIVHRERRRGVAITFHIFPNSIPYDANVKLGLPDGLKLKTRISMDFSPDGLTFSPPASLRIYGFGLNLSRVDPSKIKFFYYNEDTGLWEPYPAEVTVNVKLGMVRVVADIYHFSRYGIASSE